MRGTDETSGSLFCYVDLGERIPPERLIYDRQAIARQSSERRASLLLILFSVRSERLLMEQMQYNLLLRWFAGLGIDAAVWVPTVFTKNRDRLLMTDMSRKVMCHCPVRGICVVPMHRKKIDLRRENHPPDRFLILLTFGWAKTVGGTSQTMYRGIERVRSRFILTMVANNLARLPRLRKRWTQEHAADAPTDLTHQPNRT